MMTEGCVKRELGGCRLAEWDQSQNTICTPKNDEFLVVNYCHYCYNEIYEKMPSWHEPSGRQRQDLPEIAFSFEDASEVRKVLGQWNCLS